MVARDSGTRALSVSRKDRGAILPIGPARGELYWYHGAGFTTSRYYTDTLPAWVRDFNARREPERLAGALWSLRLPPASYAEPDTMPLENGGRDFVFPHQLPSNPDSAAAALINFPWMDSLTLGLALEGVRALRLGTRASPDLLTISLSTTDAVGHAFGPDSRELHDHLLWLDLWLGQFLDSLLAEVVSRDSHYGRANPGGEVSKILLRDQSVPQRGVGPLRGAGPARPVTDWWTCPASPWYRPYLARPGWQRCPMSGGRMARVEDCPRSCSRSTQRGRGE